MERIHYSDDSFVTGNDIAAAVFAYAEALAKRVSSATVSIPVRQMDGSIGRARLLLGPASQLASESETSNFGEVTDVELVASLRRATDMLSATEDGRFEPIESNLEYHWEL